MVSHPMAVVDAAEAVVGDAVVVRAHCPQGTREWT